MRTSFLALALALLAGSAAAQNRPALRFDPNKIEFATPWAQSSPCLGDRSDPVCFVQTMVVCGVVEQRPECSGGHYSLVYNPQRYDRIEYRVARGGIVPFERLEAMQEALLGEIDVDLSPMTARRAVVAQFWVRQSMCPASGASCEGSLWTDFLIVVERKRRGWVFVVSDRYDRYRWYAD
ncbi:MAG: hypothetical protein NBV67_15985 [Tagaea sp.]|nr:hypothetical protein [Tagaea sp.]